MDIRYVIVCSLILLFCIPISVNAQKIPQKYAKVKISLKNNTISDIAALGLEYDHGDYSKVHHLINIFSEQELALLRKKNIPYKVIIDDMEVHYLAQKQKKSIGCR